MIDLRKVEPLKPAHLYFDFEENRWNFSCLKMKSGPNNTYQCSDASCRLVYNKFCFIGYYKNLNLPFPQIAYPENILDKAMACKSRCALLESSDRAGFYACAACLGNFMKHPEFGITSVPGDWLAQDPRVLKYFIQKAQESAKALRKDVAKWSSPELRKRLMAPYEEAEKIFVTEILSKCRL